MNLPFEFGHIVTGNDFINRKVELEKLKINFESGVNTMLISPRRWGKSSLVKQVISSLQSRKDLVICYIDLFAVRTEEELLNLFAKEVIKQTSSKWEDWVESVKAFIKNAAPKVAFGAPDMQAELELAWHSKKIDPIEIFQLPEAIAKKKKIKIVVCIDEFQNIAWLSDPVAAQKQMRSVWQNHQSTSYCLFGSKKSWLTDIFTSYSMPFYRFGDLMYLEKISSTHWEKYIIQQFERTGKKISSELALKITSLVQLHPQYVQQLAQKVWICTDKEVTTEALDHGVEELLNTMSIAYQRDVELLTSTQLNFLRAFIAGVREFNSAETLSSYHLGSSSNIVRIKKALEQKEIMDFFNKEPAFVDPVFQLWITKKFFKLSSP
ncbi:MAG: ATP-binding protein [Cyclobacteriaceae bacterium]|nr:ATP-binding protein [Cyclobacteriaceae bacterium]